MRLYLQLIFLPASSWSLKIQKSFLEKELRNEDERALWTDFEQSSDTSDDMEYFNTSEYQSCFHVGYSCVKLPLFFPPWCCKFCAGFPPSAKCPPKNHKKCPRLSKTVKDGYNCILQNWGGGRMEGIPMFSDGQASLLPPNGHHEGRIAHRLDARHGQGKHRGARQGPPVPLLTNNAPESQCVVPPDLLERLLGGDFGKGQIMDELVESLYVPPEYEAVSLAAAEAHKCTDAGCCMTEYYYYNPLKGMAHRMNKMAHGRFADAIEQQLPGASEISCSKSIPDFLKQGGAMAEAGFRWSAAQMHPEFNFKTFPILYGNLAINYCSMPSVDLQEMLGYAAATLAFSAVKQVAAAYQVFEDHHEGVERHRFSEKDGVEFLWKKSFNESLPKMTSAASPEGIASPMASRYRCTALQRSQVLDIHLKCYQDGLRACECVRRHKTILQTMQCDMPALKMHRLIEKCERKSRTHTLEKNHQLVFEKKAASQSAVDVTETAAATKAPTKAPPTKAPATVAPTKAPRPPTTEAPTETPTETGAPSSESPWPEEIPGFNPYTPYDSTYSEAMLGFPLPTFQRTLQICSIPRKPCVEFNKETLLHWIMDMAMNTEEEEHFLERFVD